MPVPRPTWQTFLESLPRDRLIALAERLGIEVGVSWEVGRLINALLATPSATAEAILGAVMPRGGAYALGIWWECAKPLPDDPVGRRLYLNCHILLLSRALIGAISANFRRITIDLDPDLAVVVRVLLERDDPADREEIDDAVHFEFIALQADMTIEVRSEVIVDDRDLTLIDLPGDPVYGRREA